MTQITAEAGVKELKDALAAGDEPHLLTGDQYKQTLRDGRRIVDCTGAEVGDVTAQIVEPTHERRAHGEELQGNFLHQAVQRLFLREQLVAEIDQILRASVLHRPSSVLL